QNIINFQVLTYLSLFFHFHFSSYSGSLNPTVTCLPSVTIGRFNNIPSDANTSINSSSDAFFTLSFKPNSRYFFPLVLKNFFNSSPLFLYNSLISWAVGVCLTICNSSKSTPLFSNHFFAFLHVLHVG